MTDEPETKSPNPCDEATDLESAPVDGSNGTPTIQSSPTPTISSRSSNTDQIYSYSEPASPPPPAVPPKDPQYRPSAVQPTIESYFAQAQSSLVQLDTEGRHSHDEERFSVTTQSSPPSECGSQDSEASFARLRPPIKQRRRKSSGIRTAGERDDGACGLISPPPPLRE